MLMRNAKDLGYVPASSSKLTIMANFGVKNKGDRGFSADRQLSSIYTELWELDENRLTPGKHYRIHLQGGQHILMQPVLKKDRLRSTVCCL